MSHRKISREKIRINLEIRRQMHFPVSPIYWVNGFRQPQYIYDPGQPFRSHFVLYRSDFGLIKQTLNRTSRCNKVDAVRLYASYRLNLLLLKGQRCVHCSTSKKRVYAFTLMHVMQNSAQGFHSEFRCAELHGIAWTFAEFTGLAIARK